MRLVLTYHSSRLEAPNREACDLFALERDLVVLADEGVPVVSLDALLDNPLSDGVAVTIDDGVRMDWESCTHSRLGALPSVREIVESGRDMHPDMVVSCFVIACPIARAQIAETIEQDYGPELLHDRWWGGAASSGFMTIENHSNDHNHPDVARTAQRNNRKGSFLFIETEAEAEAEIARASDTIATRCGVRPRYFAYPFGDVPRYVSGDWLPRRGEALGLRAAFTTEARALSHDDDRWALPRFVSGRDWTTDTGLRSLLRDCRRA